MGQMFEDLSWMDAATLTGAKVPYSVVATIMCAYYELMLSSKNHRQSCSMLLSTWETKPLGTITQALFSQCQVPTFLGSIQLQAP